MLTTKKAESITMGMNIEEKLPKPLWQGHVHSQEECYLGIVQQKEMLYLETDALNVGLGASLLEVRECGSQGMKHPTMQYCGQ